MDYIHIPDIESGLDIMQFPFLARCAERYNSNRLKFNYFIYLLSSNMRALIRLKDEDVIIIIIITLPN